MMTNMQRRLMGVVGAMVLGAAMAASAAQGLTGLRAEWGDLETWSHPVAGSRETELGLGLQVNGPNGLAFVAFLARVDPQNPSKSPAEVSVQVGAGQRVNPNLIRRPSLAFVADARAAKPVSIDLSSSLIVDNMGPGAVIENGVARMRAADVGRAAKAVTLSGNVFGFDISFRPDQIKALLDFAVRAHIPVPKDIAPEAPPSR
jgi:hypothetical protein